MTDREYKVGVAVLGIYWTAGCLASTISCPLPVGVFQHAACAALWSGAFLGTVAALTLFRRVVRAPA